MTYECTVVEQPAQPTLQICLRVPAQDMTLVLEDAYGALKECLAELGEEPAGPPFAAYPNQNTQNLEVAVGFPVSHPIRNQGGIKAGEILAGKYASCLHTGPLGELATAYRELAQWVAREGFQSASPAYEFFLDDPANTPPHELRTRIMVPLRTP